MAAHTIRGSCPRASARSAAYPGMDRDRLLTFTPVNHPNPKVRRVGFELTDPYVEQCWSAVVGPSGTLLLRRLPVLWDERAPAEIRWTDMSRSLGLGSGTGSRSRLSMTLKRLEEFRLARGADGSGGEFEVFVEVSPLTRPQLARAPEWTRATHERLFGAHLDGLAGRSERQVQIASISARLDRLQHLPGRSAEQAAVVDRSLAR